MIKLLADIRKTDVAIAGGKGASLGEMISAGIPVPPGFVISPDSFNESGQLTAETSQAVLDTFDKLAATRVAVRSSAIAEDGSDASWAGQMETFLNVMKEDLLDHVHKCWESTKSDRVQAYMQDKKLGQDSAMAVVVQAMVDSEVAGVMFTVNPITKDHKQIMIEACLGLGELLVSGEVNPENIVLNKTHLEVVQSSPPDQDEMMIYDHGNKRVPVPEAKQGKSILGSAKLKQLGELGKKIEAHYAQPQDIEWAILDDKVYIIQARPITTL